MLLKDNIPVKYVFGKIKYEVLAVTVYSVIIAILYDNFHLTRISIPISLPAIMGSILSLLLAFRSNQAYDRWWEARTLWGAMVNDSRTIARMILNFVDEPFYNEDAELFKKKFIYRQIAWMYVVGQSLRKAPVFSGTDGLLTQKEIDQVKKFGNKGNGLLELHSSEIAKAYKNGWINQYQQVALERILEKLCDSMGGCERIKNTIFPATYSLYTHICLILFIAFLPFALIEYFDLMEIPLVVAISASLFLIEKMSIHLQDPFENKPTDTPVTTIAKMIERDLKQMLKENKMDEIAEQDRIETEQKIFYVL